jgi:prophage antirepressor-like protein
MKKIVVLKDKNNTIWFNALSACIILGYKEHKKVIAKFIDKKIHNST